jgi:hypothetical protein
MALIVEDGSGLANSESYASVAEASAYFMARAQADAWDVVDDKEAALRLATDYIEQTYRLRWIGLRGSDDQALSWPRENAMMPDMDEFIANNVVPVEVKRAAYELALRSASAPLLTDTEREVSSEAIAGALSVTYVAGSNRQTKYEAVERVLRPLLLAGSSQSLVTRA